MITDDAALDDPGFLEAALALGNRCGARLALHLRSRSASARRLFDHGVALIPTGATLFLNDRADIALALGTGIQLRSQSMPVRVARRLLPQATIGYSAHTVEEAQMAERDGADFVLAGTIYPSPSHGQVAAQGPDFVSRLTRSVSLPVIAIGGIDGGRARICRQHGAYGVAVIRAVWHASDPVAAAERLLEVVD